MMSPQTVPLRIERFSLTCPPASQMVMISLLSSVRANTLILSDTHYSAGVHCDTVGNVYAGCGDGVHVWNTSGTLLGKIFVGEGVANFQFAGKGRMVLLAETQLWYATLAAEGAPIL